MYEKYTREFISRVKLIILNRRMSSITLPNHPQTISYDHQIFLSKNKLVARDDITHKFLLLSHCNKTADIFNRKKSAYYMRHFIPYKKLLIKRSRSS